jgi:hypothetical protein
MHIRTFLARALLGSLEYRLFHVTMSWRSVLPFFSSGLPCRLAQLYLLSHGHVNISTYVSQDRV